VIKVLIADDHAIVRSGLKQILDETGGEIHVQGEAANGREVLEKIQAQDWDVLVLDITMPGRSGLDILKDIRQLKPKLPILILSMHAEEQFATRMLKAGASGYLNKESAPEELVKAIRKVCGGGKYVSPAQAERLVSELSSGDIAKATHLSVKTVSTYRTRILDKMKLETNAQLTHYAIKGGLVE
jgi:two-component system invasion response regulator UvrY